MRRRWSASALREFPYAVEQFMAQIPEDLGTGRRCQMPPGVPAGCEVELEPNHTGARMLKNDDGGAGIRLVPHVDAIPVRVASPFRGAIQTQPTRAKQSRAEQFQFVDLGDCLAALRGLDR